MDSYLAHTTKDGRTQTVLQHLTATAQRLAKVAVHALPLIFPAGLQFGSATKGTWELGLQAHDLGKYSDGFQNRLMHHGPKVDHATAGAFECFKLGQPYAAFAVAGHHSGLPDGGSQTDSPDSSSFLGRMNRALQGKLPEYGAWKSELALSNFPLPNDLEPQMEGMIFYPHAVFLLGGCGLFRHSGVHVRHSPDRRNGCDSPPYWRNGSRFTPPVGFRPMGL